MRFVVDHDVWHEAHVSQGVDALEVLLRGGVVVGEHEYLCRMAELAVKIIGKALQAFEYLVFLLVIVPCKVDGF